MINEELRMMLDGTRRRDRRGCCQRAPARFERRAPDGLLAAIAALRLRPPEGISRVCFTTSMKARSVAGTSAFCG
jgi:hypothetical protein